MNALTTFQAPRSRWLHIMAAVSLVAVSWTHALDQMAREHIDQSLIQALAVFGIARGLNGFLTVAKSTEVSSGLLSFQPLEALDPIHDLVEQFSSLMSLATISLGIQKLLLEITATTGFKLLLSGFAAFFVVTSLLNWTRLSVWAWRFMLFAIMVRFLFVGLILFNALADNSFLYQQTAAKEQDIRVLSEDLIGHGVANRLSGEQRAALLEERMKLETQGVEINRQLVSLEVQIQQLDAERISVEAEIEKAPRSMLRRPRIDNGLKERRDTVNARLEGSQQHERTLLRQQEEIRGRLAEIENTLNGREENSWMDEIAARFQAARDIMRIASLKERSEKLVEGIIALMALFFLRTVMFPIVFLYLLIKLFKSIWRVHPVEALRLVHQPTRDQIHGRPVGH